MQCAKSCGRYWQYSNEQNRRVLLLHGAYNLFVEQALNRHYTKEDEIVNLDKNNKVSSNLSENLPLYLSHDHILLVLDRQT